MDFTRQPIIESVITAKEGCKLVVRSSKGAGQEEYFVDAVEVVSFGHALFFRSLEKPKAFLAPASDYEVLEVREARMVLKHVGTDRTIRIGGGREGSRPSKEAEKAPVQEEAEVSSTLESRMEKRRDRRRSVRRRRGQEGAIAEEGTVEEVSGEIAPVSEESVVLDAPKAEGAEQKRHQRRAQRAAPVDMSNPMLTSLLPPPPNLISETIDRYKENEMFRGAFFTKGEKVEGGEVPAIPLKQPEYGSYEMSAEEEEAVYRQRMLSAEEEARAQREFAKQQSQHEEEEWEFPPVSVEEKEPDEESKSNNSLPG